MPYVPETARDGDELRASAERRWEAVAALRPDLAPAIELQRRLLEIVMRLTAAVERDGLPQVSLPPAPIASKLARGVPALAGEPIALPVAMLSEPLLELCAELGRGGAGDAAAHVRSAIESFDISPGSLLAASLARDQHAIRQGAVHRGLAPDLVWLVAELAVSPVAHLIGERVMAASEEVARAVDEWGHGYCPVCGSWPALAEVVDGRRILRCSFCAAGWEPRSYACIYCGEGGEAFVTAAPDEEIKNRRVEVCGTCGGYLKTIDVAELSPFPLLAIADLETMDLDVAAMAKGYGRPPLKSFADAGRLPANRG
jgi:FdhE protein